jgi:hypothetical protein
VDARPAGTLVCVCLVDRVGRLPLLHLSSLLSIAVTLVLAVGGVAYIAHRQVDVMDRRAVPRAWPFIQLATLAVLAVRLWAGPDARWCTRLLFELRVAMWHWKFGAFETSLPDTHRVPHAVTRHTASRQATNGLAFSSAAWVVITESQALAVRPAAVALCIAAANLSTGVVEVNLLCALGVLYYVLVLAVSFLALVSEHPMRPAAASDSREAAVDLARCC